MGIGRGMAALLVVAAAVLLFASCSSELGYYSQCVQGHLGILARRQPIERLLADPATGAGLKEKLALVLRIRDFASRELLLPENGSYRCYVDLNRPEVVWNVVAAPEFSLQPRQWCFPVAGCVSYRGYYAQEGARSMAESLQRRGDDVHFYGVEAYSTLGWFDDPVFNTFVEQSEARIAGLIFHELAHQKVYIKDDSAFNEAFAEAVAQEGLARWLRQAGRLDELARWQESVRQDVEFVALLQEARGRLEKLYVDGGDAASMRAGKARVFQELELAYVRLKERWGGYDGYDRWFASPLNNARLVSVGTYRSQLPAFQALLRQQGGDLTAFYRAVGRLGELPSVVRRDRMQQLATAAEAGPGPDIASLWPATPGS